MSSTSLRLVSAIRRAKTQTYLSGTPDNYFDEDELPAFEFIRSFVREHNAWPTAATVKAETGVTLVRTKEPVGYYLDQARQRALYMALNEPFKEITDAIREQRPDDVIRIMRDCVTVSSALGDTNSSQITNYTDMFEQIDQDYRIAKLQYGIRGVPTGYPLLDEKFDGWLEACLYAVVGRPGRGKALPLDARILLSNGKWVANGDIQVGQRLASIDGKPSKVLGVYDQGERNCYKITFDDGRTAVCDEDHLWEVVNSRWAQKRKVLTAKQLVYHCSVSRNKGRIGIPLHGGMHGNSDLPLEPYLLGALIGDGTMSGLGVELTSADDFIVQKVQSLLPVGHTLRNCQKYRYLLNAPGWGRNLVKARLHSLGLHGSRSEHKFIPDCYLSANYSDRLSLLQGLMDTDGYAATSGNCCYYTSSAQLAHDVQFLVRSLGGVSKISSKKTNKLPAYRISVRLPNQREAFSLPRKAERIPAKGQYADHLSLKIKSIEKVAANRTRCIEVSHPSKLYIIDDFVVTHNTQKLVHAAKAAKDAGRSVLFLSNEMGKLQIARRIFGLDAVIDPKLLKSGKLSTAIEREMRRQMDILRDSDQPPIYLLAGNFKKSVDSLEAAVDLVEPDMIIGDAAYLMKANDRTKASAKHELLSDVIEAWQDMLIRKNRPGLISVQFNRTGQKKTKNASDDNEESDQNAARNPLSHLDLSKIAGTDTIGQVCTGVVGIDKVEPPHDTDQRYAGILKHREGEDYGWYRYNYKFRPPNFSQIDDYRHYESQQQTAQGPDLSYMDVEA